MRSILFAAAALGLAGCTQFDVSEAKRIAVDEFGAPGQARFRDLTAKGRHVCGQISVQDRLGLETGFRGFVVDLDARQVLLEPMLDVEAPLTPVQHAMSRLDRGMSLMEFSAVSYRLCGQSVASPAFEAARESLVRHVGIAVVPRLDDSPL